MEDIIKVVKSLEDFGLLLKGVSETIQNEGKEQNGGFLSMLLGTSGASLLGDILAGKEMKGKEQNGGFLSMLLGTSGASLLGDILAGKEMKLAGEGFIRADYGSSIKSKDF